MRQSERVFNSAKKFSIVLITLLIYLSGNVLFLQAKETDTVSVYGKNTCPYTNDIKTDLELAGVNYTYIDVNENPELLTTFYRKTAQKFGAGSTLYMPVVEVNGEILMRPRFPEIAALLKDKKADDQSRTGSLSWRTDYRQALETARKENKFMIVNFAHHGCGYCIKLDAEVFDKKEFKEYFKDFILVRLEFGDTAGQDADTIAYNKKLFNEYKVRGYPSVFFLSPEGENLGKYGYREGGTVPWITVAEMRLAPYKRRIRMQ